MKREHVAKIERPTLIAPVFFICRKVVSSCPLQLLILISDGQASEGSFKDVETGPLLFICCPTLSLNQ